MYPNPEQLAAAVLAPLGTVVTWLPDDLETAMPIIRVRALGGTDDEITDAARVAVEVYAGTYAQAWTLARQVRALLTDRPAATDEGMLDTADVEVAPQEIPYGNRAVRYVTATYRLYARRAAA